MKLLRSTLDKTAPLFEKGGKLEKLYPAYEAGDTFLYTPGEVTDGPSHVRDGMDLKRMMTLVIVALIPAIFMACYNTGYQANRGPRAACWRPPRSPNRRGPTPPKPPPPLAALPAGVAA